MTAHPLVTVIVPARDEVADIEECLDAIARQTYPLDLIEVLVVDGASKDGTAARASAALGRYEFRRADVIRNEQATTPSSLNAGLRAASGDVVCRVDARSLVPPNYVETCVDVLATPNIAVVGGAQIAEARVSATLVERGIVRALRNPYTTGLARYRRGDSSGPADTTYLGAFRRKDLLAAGGWDERFLANQDFELNRRMARQGVVWFEAALEVAYRPRRSLRALARQYRRFGRWKAAGWLEEDMEVLPRQAALLLAPPVAAAVFWRLLRRHPRLALAAAAASGLAVEGTSPDRAAAPADRLLSLTATAVLTVSWWLGAMEQSVRHVLGGRLISPEQPSP